MISGNKIRSVAAVLLVSSVCGTSLAAAEDNPHSVVSRDSILIGDQVSWTMDFEAGDGETLVLPEGRDISDGLEIVGGVKIDTLSSEGGTFRMKASAMLTSFDEGSYSLPPFPLYIRRADGSVDTVDMSSHSLSVATIPVDTASFVPYDIKGQFRYPVTFREAYPWVITGLAVVFVLYLAYRLVVYGKKKRRSASSGMSVPVDPAAMALRRLEEIDSRKEWKDGRAKVFYTDVTDTLRAYLESVFRIQAMESTSAEILSELNALKDSRIDRERMDELAGLFELSDLVKFAKYRPEESENERVVPVAVRFVKSTSPGAMSGEDGEQSVPSGNADAADSDAVTVSSGPVDSKEGDVNDGSEKGGM